MAHTGQDQSNFEVPIGVWVLRLRLAVEKRKKNGNPGIDTKDIIGERGFATPDPQAGHVHLKKHHAATDGIGTDRVSDPRPGKIGRK